MMKKLILVSKSDIPFVNLALEEYLVRHFSLVNTQILMIYINRPCVVLGKNQNVYREVHIDILKHDTVQVCRRISGGGAVGHDLGNINFSFFEPYHISRVNQYRPTADFLMGCLKKIGVDCHLNDRNAIMLAENEKKISGSAQFSTSTGILSHYTMLYEADLENIRSWLKTNDFEVECKSSPSVRSQIDNVGNHTDFPIADFLELVAREWNADEVLLLDEIIENQMFKDLLIQYNAPEWRMDKAGNATLKLPNSVQITTENSKIVAVDNAPFDVQPYLGRRVYCFDIYRDDPFWELFYGHVKR